MIKIAMIVAFITSFLFGVQPQKENPLTVLHLKDGTMLVRVALNYANPREHSRRLRGSNGMLSVHLPVPGNWKVLNVSGYISYTPSILLLKDNSSGVISFNNINIKQFKLFDNMDTGVKFKIKSKYIKDYNELRIEMIQHYAKRFENNTNSQLWTDVSLSESYIEYHIAKTAIPEELSSLTTHMMDSKQYELEPLNYVISKHPSDEELRHYALITGGAANAIKYRMTPISVSHTLALKKQNIVITTKAEAKKKLKPLNYKYFFSHDPLLSLKFNDENFELISTQKISFQTSEEGLHIVKKNALSGKSLYMDGKGKLALSNLHIEKSNEVSVAFWFRPSSMKQRSILFGFEKFRLVLDKKRLGFSTSSNDIYGSKVKDLSNKWHHIVAVFNKTNLRGSRIFIDGKSLALRQLKGRSRVGSFSDFAFIGGRLEDHKKNYKGMLDQFYFFNKPLSAKFAYQLYSLASRYKKHSYDEALFISEKISHDINLLRNPSAPEKAILVIAPKTKEEIEGVIYGLYKQDLSFYFRSGLDVKSVEIPNKAPAYSAKDYIPVDTKIYLSDLGYKTQVLKGWYPPSISIDFKVYPDHHFSDKDKIDAYLNYVFPTTVSDDSVANIFLNKKFAKQIQIMEQVKSDSLSAKVGGLLEDSNKKQLPAFLLDKGHNTLRFDFSLVPKMNGYSISNSENLLVMIMDNSYFILPKSKRWIEMPYMQYIHTSAYPYSIYPDLQDTQLILANDDAKTIASAMNFMFFISQEIQSYPYYVSITKDVNKIEKNKHLVFFGTIFDKSLQDFSKNAPVTFSQTLMDKPYPFIKRFIKHESITNEDRLIKYRFVSKMKETNQLDQNLLVEMFRSPYNEDKTALMFVAQSPHHLNYGLKSLLAFENRHLLDGDTLLYNPVAEAGVTFDIAPKYVLTSMNIIDRVSLLLNANPLFYVGSLIFFLVVVSWFVRGLLLDFKRRKHKYVE